MFGILFSMLFPDDGKWVWSRRIMVSSAAVFLSGFVHSIFFDTDPVHVRTVLEFCMEGLGLVFSIFVTGKVVHAGLTKNAPGAPPPDGGPR